MATQILYVDNKLKMIHLYTIGGKLKGMYSYSNVCVPKDFPTFTAQFYPEHDRVRRPIANFNYGFLDEIHRGTRKTGLVLTEDNISFSEEKIRTVDLTTKPILHSTKPFRDRLWTNSYLEDQLKQNITLSYDSAGISECNPFAFDSGKNLRFFMTTSSSQDDKLDVDCKTGEIVYESCAMHNIMELTPEGAAYVALVKGSGEILNAIPEKTTDKLFNRIGLSHVTVSFVDLENSQRIVSQLTNHELTGYFGIHKGHFDSYPVLSKTPFKTGVDRMNSYLDRVLER